MEATATTTRGARTESRLYRVVRGVARSRGRGADVATLLGVAPAGRASAFVRDLRDVPGFGSDAGRCIAPCSTPKRFSSSASTGVLRAAPLHSELRVGASSDIAQWMAKASSVRLFGAIYPPILAAVTALHKAPRPAAKPQGRVCA